MLLIVFTHKFLALCPSTISGTTAGSAKVLISPNSSNLPLAIFLKILLIILPLLVLGKPLTTNHLLGTLNAAILFLINNYKSDSILSVFVTPSLRMM